MYSAFFLLSCGDSGCSNRMNGICISLLSKAAPSPANSKMSSITSVDTAVSFAFATAVLILLSF
jgi:hypothetical protein